MLANPGTRLGLIPHPAAELSERMVLVEGPPDMIAARSRGIPAIAVPGDHAWEPAWAHCFPADRSRSSWTPTAPAAAAASGSRTTSSRTPRRRHVDPAPGRDDGYDLTDWLDAQFVTGATAPRLLRHAAAAQPTLGPDGSSRPNEPTLTGSRWAQDPPATPCSAPTQPSPGSVRHHPGVSTH